MSRSGVLTFVTLASFVVGFDLGALPAEQRAAAISIRAVQVYQATLSPLARRAGMVCRFEPTCSHYAVAVLERHGALGGSWRTARRLLRCGPWTPAGTLDPP